MNCTGVPLTDGFSAELTVTEAVAFVTISVSGAADVLGAFLSSPLYTTVNTCVPTARFGREKVVGEPISGTVAIGFPPSSNCNVPVAVKSLVTVWFTTAATTAGWPNTMVPPAELI